MKRKKIQARDGFDIVGIAKNETLFTDWEALHQRPISEDEALADPNWQAPFDEIDCENEDAPGQQVEPSKAMMALDDLPPRWKQAVELHMEKMTQEEAAEIMNISQPRYFEILRGKDGREGALGRLRNVLIAEGLGPKQVGNSRA
ncbi:hypothetical protein HZB60_12310 [candidate division KSB1 bacterium]|nr:hypothetical protein [candidate division KSB1 bacterium]